MKITITSECVADCIILNCKELCEEGIKDCENIFKDKGLLELIAPCVLREVEWNLVPNYFNALREKEKENDKEET